MRPNSPAYKVAKRQIKFPGGRGKGVDEESENA
jgi:hypothetical protein